MGKGPFIVISQTDPDPMYKQVIDQIREAIVTGEIGPEERLPSIRELSKELALSPITVKRAYSDLELEGYIVTRSGLGSFAARIDGEKLREAKLSEIREEIRKAVAKAGRYGIGTKEIKNMIDDIEEEKK